MADSASPKPDSAPPKTVSPNSGSSKPDPAPPKSVSPKSSYPKPDSTPKTTDSAPKTTDSAPKTTDSAVLVLTLGQVFLPSELALLEIGMHIREGHADEWKHLVKQIDIYSDSPDVLLEKELPSIKHKNTYVVWTPRAAMGNGKKGIDRGVKGPKGGIWEGPEIDEGNIPIEDDQGNIVGYYSILRFREGGRDGNLTDWCMKEFLVSEDDEAPHVICTIVFEDQEVKQNLAKFKKASDFLTEKALAERNLTTLETTGADSDSDSDSQVGEPCVKANERLVGWSTTAARSKKTQVARSPVKTRAEDAAAIAAVTRSTSKKPAGVSGTIEQRATRGARKTRTKSKVGTSVVEALGDNIAAAAPVLQDPALAERAFRSRLGGFLLKK